MVRTLSVQEHTADLVSREDTCASLGAKSNFKETINIEPWEPATLWPSIVEFHRGFWKVEKGHVERYEDKQGEAYSELR